MIEPGAVAFFIGDGQAVRHLPTEQRAMQSVLDRLEFREMKPATVIRTRGDDQHYVF